MKTKVKINKDEQPVTEYTWEEVKATPGVYCPVSSTKATTRLITIIGGVFTKPTTLWVDGGGTNRIEPAENQTWAWYRFTKCSEKVTLEFN